MVYAKNTKVPVHRSQVELSKLLDKHGATMTAVGRQRLAVIAMFELRGARVRIQVPMPGEELTKQAFTRPERQDRDALWKLVGLPQPNGFWSWSTKRQGEFFKTVERQRWRALILLVKAKLEAIAMGQTTVEREFLPDLLLADGSSVYERISGELSKAVRGSSTPLLLGSGG